MHVEHFHTIGILHIACVWLIMWLWFQGIIQLEKELAYLGSVCAAALMKKDLALPIGSMSTALVH